MGVTFGLRYMSHNACKPLHRDLKNASGFPIWVKGIRDFRGGGLWVQGTTDEGPVCKTLPSGNKVAGAVYDIKAGPIVFHGTQWHQPEAWDGDRWVISAFVPAGVKNTTAEHWRELEDFRLSGCWGSGEVEGCYQLE